MDQLTRTKEAEVAAKPQAAAQTAQNDQQQQQPKQQPCYGTVTADVLNVRLGPGKNYGILGSFRQGKQITVIGKSDNWLNVMYGTQSAWVHKSFVKLSGDVPVSNGAVDNTSNNALVAIVQSRGFKTNQDLINFFINEHGNGNYNKGAAAAAKYGVDLDKLCQNRKGSAMDTANSVLGQAQPTPAVETPKEEPAVETPKEEPAVETPKEEPVVEGPKEEPKEEPKQEPKQEEKPDPNSLEAIVAARGFQTNQDLINYFITELGANSYSKGAQAAAQYGLNLDVLCQNRKGSAIETAKGKIASGPVEAAGQTPKASAVSGDEAVANFIRDNFPNGYTAVFVYKGTDQVDEFVRQAEAYAATYNPIGIKGSKLGTQLFKQVKTYDEFKTSLLTLGESVKKCLADHPREGFDDSKCGTIKNLTIMTHGYETGLNFGGGSGKNFNMSKIEDFTSSIKGYVADDVRVQLYACNTARNENTAESWADRGVNGGSVSAEDNFKGGKGSFAQTLAESLGENASVYGHTTAGPLCNNYCARVFGKDADGAENGKHMYDICFPADYLSAEAQRLNKTDAQIRKETFEYYCNHFKGDYGARDSFVDPEGFAERMREGWKASH